MSTKSCFITNPFMPPVGSTYDIISNIILDLGQNVQSKDGVKPTPHVHSLVDL
jgi:hypothetical protein